MQATGGAALTTHDTLDIDPSSPDPITPDPAPTGPTPTDPTPTGPTPPEPTPTDPVGPAAGVRTPSPRALGIFIALTFVVLAVDLITKHLTVTQLAGRDPVRLLGGAVYLVYVRNSGAAFSLGQDYTFIFPVVTFIVVGWIIFMVRRLASTPWAAALGLVLGGAVGNLGDRIFRAPGPFVGHVVDMISVFDSRGQGFPVFNVADSALCVGVALAMLLEFTGRRRDGTRVLTAKPTTDD